MKKRQGDPWMSAADYGKSLSGFGVNLLVRQIQPSLEFAQRVLEASVVYSDVDFAVLQHSSTQWMLHADHTYSDHPMRGIIADQEFRGAGIELRLHNCDPDRAENLARQHDYTILDASTDKPHGLREVFIVDPAGFVWVLDRPLSKD